MICTECMRSDYHRISCSNRMFSSLVNQEPITVSLFHDPNEDECEVGWDDHS